MVWFFLMVEIFRCCICWCLGLESDVELSPLPTWCHVRLATHHGSTSPALPSCESLDPKTLKPYTATCVPRLWAPTVEGLESIRSGLRGPCSGFLAGFGNLF